MHLLPVEGLIKVHLDIPVGILLIGDVGRDLLTFGGANGQLIIECIAWEACLFAFLSLLSLGLLYLGCMLILDLSSACVVRHALQFVGRHLMGYARVVHIECAVLAYLLDSDLLGVAISIEQVIYCSRLWGDSPVDSVGCFLLPAFVDGIDRFVHCVVCARGLLGTDNVIYACEAYDARLVVTHDEVLTGLVGVDTPLLIHDKVAILDMHFDVLPFRTTESGTTERPVLVLL